VYRNSGRKIELVQHNKGESLQAVAARRKIHGRPEDDTNKGSTVADAKILVSRGEWRTNNAASEFESHVANTWHNLTPLRMFLRTEQFCLSWRIHSNFEPNAPDTKLPQRSQFCPYLILQLCIPNLESYGAQDCIPFIVFFFSIPASVIFIVPLTSYGSNDILAREGTFKDAVFFCNAIVGFWYVGSRLLLSAGSTSCFRQLAATIQVTHYSPLI